jgi:hypothetical protein
MCAIYVDDFGDEEIYDAYRKDKTLVKTLCHGKGIYTSYNFSAISW